MKGDRGSGAVGMEALEGRTLMSVAADDFRLEPGSAAAKGGGGGGGGGAKPAAPEIRLDLVALHEFGHSLGLDHNGDKNSILYSYYNPNYDLSKFNAANDVAVAQLQTMYSSENIAAGKTKWTDAADRVVDGKITLTYSFMLDGAWMDKGTSNTFATLDATFGAGQWQSIFTQQLDRWAQASGGTLAFVPFNNADGIENSIIPAGASGLAQNDPNFGDIRIGMHRFDGASKVLAHAYFPSTTSTIGGDAHFDYQENWTLAPSASLTLASSTTSTPTTSGTLMAASRTAPSASTFATSRLILDVDEREELLV